MKRTRKRAKKNLQFPKIFQKLTGCLNDSLALPRRIQVRFVRYQKPVALDSETTPPPVTLIAPSTRMRASWISFPNSIATPQSKEPLSEKLSQSLFDSSIGWRFVTACVLLCAIELIARERSYLSQVWAQINPSIRLLSSSVANRMHLNKKSIVASKATLCPKEMAMVHQGSLQFCIDRYEASLVEVLPDHTETPWSPYHSVEGHIVKAVSKPNAIPQAYISRDQAEQACLQAGKRLCSDDEWITTCEGPARTTYPYGNTRDENSCNTEGKSPLGALFGSQYDDYHSMNDPILNTLENTVARTGSFTECTNSFGVYDLVGNLHEWTSETSGTFRGGYYLDTEQNGSGCRYVTKAHNATYHDYSTGFRCCRDLSQEIK